MFPFSSVHFQARAHNHTFTLFTLVISFSLMMKVRWMGVGSVCTLLGMGWGGCREGTCGAGQQKAGVGVGQDRRAVAHTDGWMERGAEQQMPGLTPIAGLFWAAHRQTKAGEDPDVKYTCWCHKARGQTVKLLLPILFFAVVFDDLVHV